MATLNVNKQRLDPVNIELYPRGERGSRGISIKDIEQTKLSTESSGINEITVTLDNDERYKFNVTNGEKGEKGERGEKGEKGDTGAKGDTYDDTEIKNAISAINANIKANYYNKADTDTKLDAKANTTDISKIKEEQTTQNGNISKNADEITNLKNENSYLQNVVKQAFTETSASGTELTIDNTIEARMEMKLNGNTRQNTTTGKNLIKLYKATNPLVTNGLTFTRLDDNTLKIKGTSVIQCWIEVLYNLKNGTDVQTTPLFNLDVDNNYVFIAKNLSGTKDKDPTIFLQPNKENKTVSALPNTSISFSNSDGIYRGWIHIQAKTNFNDYTLQFQLEKGTTSTDFEPYTNGASPNPEYPQEVHCVKGNNVVKVTNQNLFDGIFRQGTHISSVTSNRIINKNILEAKIGKTYTLSTNLPSIYKWKITNNEKHEIADSVRTINDTTYSSTSSVTVNCTENGYLRVLVARVDDKNITPNDIVGYKFQVEQGSTATTYEPHQGKELPLDLGNIELCKIGDYQDYIYKKDDKWWKHKVIGKIVFDGTRTSWGFGTAGLENMNVANINIPSMLIQNFGLGFCNYFIRGTSKGINTLRFGANDSQLWFYVNATEFTNINDWKPWLSNNNITVYYVLATPIGEEIIDTTLINQLNEISQALSKKGTTIISQSNDDLPFNLDVIALTK